MKVVALVLAVAAGGLHAQDTRTLAITGVTIVDPTSALPSATNQTILIRDGVIGITGPSSSVRAPAGARVIDARGRFALPGLWDMHVHFMNTGVSALPLLLAHGVTSVREMGGHLDSTRAWQARMRAGTLAGPRIMTAGPILESPTYLQRVRDRSARLDGRLAVRVLPYRIGVGDSAGARIAIDSLRKLRVDFVKLRTAQSAGTFYAILREARRAGLTVSAHQTMVPLMSASDSGQRSFEHAFLLPRSLSSPEARDSLYRAFARNGSWYSPTLAVSRTVGYAGDSAARAIFSEHAIATDERRQYATPWLLEWWRMQVDERMADTGAVRARLVQEGYASTVADVRGMHAAGVKLLAGSDAGSVLVYPGFSLHEELRLMVEDAGLDPRAALWSATAGPAEFFGLDSLGTIAPGKLADIVLLDADPLADIRNTRRISAVIRAGHVYDRAALDALLMLVREAAAAR